MSNPQMPSRRVDPRSVYRRAARWLIPTALLALTPKCVLCVLAYVGLGTALGFGGPEWCGISARSPISWTTLFAWVGAAVALSAIGILASRRKKPSTVAERRG